MGFWVFGVVLLGFVIVAVQYALNSIVLFEIKVWLV